MIYPENCFINRELSWLKFNERILLETKEKDNKLLEKIKFLSITASNLDEFFMVRVASLKDMVDVKYNKKDLSGMTPKMQLDSLYEKTHEFAVKQYSILNRTLLPKLKENGIVIYSHHEEMSEKECKIADEYFDEILFPILTPMAVDKSRPFPLIRNKSLNICVLLKGKDKKNEFATVSVPQVVPRIFELVANDDVKKYILTDQIIERNIKKLFSNYEIVGAYPYRITRNADLSIDEDEASDLLTEIEKQIKKRQWGAVIRLEIEDKADVKILKFLKKELNVEQKAVYNIKGPIDLTFLMKFYDICDNDGLKEKKYIPVRPHMIKDDENIFDRIKMGDILLHHPYESFEPVVRFIDEAAKDPDVLAIKQTLYRVSGNSPIIASLAKAAENGKQVTVLVELKARFDEEHNIQWAKMLEKYGCHVIYGLVGLKTHSKITMVVRREEEGIVRYVHLGTGNYNDATAKLYTDMGLLTCKESVGEDATAAFNMISGYSEPKKWNKLTLAPFWLRKKFVYLINREIKNAKEGKDALIIAKMNSLCDKEIISLLYDASNAGVKIKLIVRGICCLKTNIESVSENIEVYSIVGTFLEHSRIFYFANGGSEEVYLASADWMPRNLDKRVEILFPVEDEKLKNEVKEILDIYLKDTKKAYVLDNDTYSKVDKRGREILSAQDYFKDYYKNLINTKTKEKTKRFIKKTHM
ncbi:polyphosphate kinase [Lachnospiraceae bacterium RM5]|nr:polyphosphate kinase [Lachnospiraceae bacterium RM5]